METNTTPFEGMPKIARLNREIIITEKIDGTNAQIFIGPISESTEREDPTVLHLLEESSGATVALRAGSKSRWLIPGKQDNFGFAAWAKTNAAELMALGDGRHLGEWWGSGVQRGYGLEKGEKRFSLFNTGRWYDVHTPHTSAIDPGSMPAPQCCRVVPVLSRGPFSLDEVNLCLDFLRTTGSQAAEGFMKPEGVIVFHTAARTMFKVTIENDESPKGRHEERS